MDTKYWNARCQMIFTLCKTLNNIYIVFSVKLARFKIKDYHLSSVRRTYFALEISDDVL